MLKTKSEKLPILKPQQVIKALEKLGFFVYRSKGSHIIMAKKGDSAHHPVIPFHRKDLTKATLRSIIRQVGLTIGEFNQLLKKR